MRLSRSDIFKKTWLWSIICGIVAGALFWFVTSILPIFEWAYDFIPFFDLFILCCLGGSYFGAGYVGWRIAEKYYYDTEKRFVKRYTLWSVATFIVLVAIVYSPLSFLGLLWSLIAPFCALKALEYVKASRT